MLSPVHAPPEFLISGDRANNLGFGQTSYAFLPEHAEPNPFSGATYPTFSIQITPRNFCPGQKYDALRTRIAGASTSTGQFYFDLRQPDARCFERWTL